MAILGCKSSAFNQTGNQIRADITEKSKDILAGIGPFIHFFFEIKAVVVLTIRFAAIEHL